MAGKDYYKILGVAKNAAKGDIKRAYRKLARKYHPDVNPGDPQAEERFKEISEAYHVLGDADRRRAYDRGPETFAQEFDMSDFFRQFQEAFGGSAGRTRVHVGGFGDLFGDLFAEGPAGQRSGPGPPRGRGRSRRGRDIEVPVELSFDEALHGVTRKVSYRRPTECGQCGGTGRRGNGACPACSGTGAQSRTESTTVKIPAGVNDGAKIRAGGRGEPGSGGRPAGDLYLRVSVAPHRLFKRKGKDLYVDVPVTVYEAALGGTIEVPTLNGATRIQLPAGTRAGQVIRLGGKGAPRSGKKGGGQGDLYVTVRIELPARLDEDVVAMLERFREKHPYNPRTGLLPS